MPRRPRLFLPDQYQQVGLRTAKPNTRKSDLSPPEDARVQMLLPPVRMAPIPAAAAGYKEEGVTQGLKRSQVPASAPIGDTHR